MVSYYSYSILQQHLGLGSTIDKLKITLLVYATATFHLLDSLYLYLHCAVALFLFTLSLFLIGTQDIDSHITLSSFNSPSNDPQLLNLVCRRGEQEFH